MSSDLIAILAGLGVGAAIAGPYVWRYRAEAIQGWKDALGVESRPATAPPAEPSRPAQPRTWTSGMQRLTIAICSLALAGSVAIAIETSDATVRLVNVVSAVVLAVALLVQLFGPGRSRSGPMDAKRSDPHMGEGP